MGILKKKTLKTKYHKRLKQRKTHLLFVVHI